MLALALAAGQSGTQIRKTESSRHLDAAELQREAESALDRVQRNDVGIGITDARYYIELSAHVEPTRAIPVLEAFFNRSHEADIRSETASVLVSLGDKDPRFWNLIFNQAQSAINEDPPDPFAPGEGGGPQELCSSLAMHDWARSRNLAPDEACKEATIGIAEKLRPLADAGDPRGIPILQQALKSRDQLVQMLAAGGLVLTGNRDAATLVMAAINQAPPAQARLLADSLIESDDPRAEAVVHQYLPDTNFADARQFRRDLAQKHRPILVDR